MYLDELIASILRHATIGDALVYEAETLLRARSTTHASTPGCAAETEDESNGNECRGPLVDGSLIWRDKFWKLVSAKCELADARHNQRQAQFCGPSGHGPSRPPIRAANYLRGIWSSGSAPSPPSMHIGRETQHLLDDLDISADDAKRADEYALLCRRVCAEFYVSEVLSRLIHFDSSGTTVSRIMQLSGRTMRQLNVALTPQCDAIFPPGFWASALAMCSGLERIVVHADTVSACLREILSSGAAMQPHEFANGRVGPQAVHAGHAASSYAARRRVFDLRIQMAAIPPDSVADLIHIGALPEPGGGGANAAKRSQAADGDAAARYVRVETERAFNLRGVSSLAEFLRPQPPKTSQVSSPDSAGGPTTTSGRDMCMSRVQLTCVPAPKSRHACPGPGHFVRHMLQSTQLWVCVRKLDLSGFQLGTTGAQGVTLLVSHPRASIEHLVLRNTGLTARGVAAIFGALQQVHAAQAGTRSPASRLKALDVSATMAQSDPDITEACKAMAGYLEASPGLVELRMSDNPISSLGMISLTDALGRNTRLRVLELDGVNLGSHVKHLTQTVARHPAMEALSIRSNGVLPRGMCMLAAAWDGVPGQLAAGPCRVGSRLVSLDLSANVFDDAVAARLAGWLASGQCGLERLAMRGLGTSTQTLGSDAAAVLVEACAGAHRLAHLDLSSQNLDDVFCEAMESALPACASLSEWVLLDNTITDDGLRLVLRGMQRRVAHAGRSPVVVDLRRNWVSAEVAQSAPPQAMADKLGVLFLDGWLKSEGQGPVR
nr:hypothetical protein HK105_001518 [Polyrhizophydium stewartii]